MTTKIIHNPRLVAPPPGYRLVYVGEIMPAKYLYWDYTSTGGTWRTSSHGRGHRVGVDFDICNSVCVPDDRPEPEEIDI